ncbi:LacI family DNA-binding transcriptional regulator [Marivita sp.]|uniref:LacI family DNA-binding transcriptional regulator n=1 Tax=Marivita sp. TaxID=2003365 RepID=UPI003F712F60
MGARVTMRDVAREAGVSPMTVSRALKQDGSVNTATRTLVRQAADKLGYVYDTTAQAFRAQRSGFLAVTLPSINNANFASTHRALTQSLVGTDLQLLLGITNYRVEEEERLMRQLLARRPEAVVLTGGHHNAATRKLLVSINVPVIEIWDLPPDPIGHVVGFSNAGAMALVVAHLVETGRRKFGFIGASADSDTRGAERRHGAVEAARTFGLPEIVQLDAGPAPVSMSDGARAVEKAGDILHNLDALICVSDPVAFGAMMALQRMGLTVPDDIGVTGFGAFEIARIATPRITTVDVGAEQIGQEAGLAILSLLNGSQSSDAPLRITLTPKLQPGNST